MTKTHVLTFTPDGAVEFTRSPDLATFFKGEGVMERVTEICKRPDENLYYIKWLRGLFATTGAPDDVAEHVHTYKHHQYVHGLDTMTPYYFKSGAGGELLFESYEVAVLYEVFTLNEMRKQGYIFGETPR